MKVRTLLVASLLAASAGVVFSGESNEDEAAVLEVVQKFFDTMASKSADEAREILDPEGSFVSVRWRDGKQVVGRSSLREYLERLEGRSESVLERMWEPDVRIHRSIAMVWTPYDFHRDGKFSHCGVDAFQLTKLESRWTITGGAYTVEPTGCAESPLGSPK